MKKILALLLAASAVWALGVKTTLSKNEAIKVTKEYIGSVYSHKETMIATRVMGYIKNISVEEGDLVKKGQVLFEVDPSDIESMLNQAEAGLLSAKSTYLDAQRDYDRFKELNEKGVVPKRDFEKMQLNMELREQGLKMAEANLEQVKAQMKYTTVRSPIDGIVIHKMSKVAEIAAPGRPVLILSSLNELRAKALVKESDIGMIRVGMPVSVYVSALNKNLPSTVSSVVPSGDPATHSYMIKASLSDVEGLLPGMYAKLIVELAGRNGIVVPLSAIIQRGGITGVFTRENGTARFIPVTVRTQMGAKVEVEGLAAGKEVIEYPGVTIQDGKPVK